MAKQQYAVIVVAEGACQHLLKVGEHEKDASGNVKAINPGPYLKEKITQYFKSHDLECNLK